MNRALHAHIERNRICRESDPMEAAMHMLLVAYATDHCAKLMERLGAGRVGA